MCFDIRYLLGKTYHMHSILCRTYFPNHNSVFHIIVRQTASALETRHLLHNMFTRFPVDIIRVACRLNKPKDKYWILGISCNVTRVFDQLLR